MFPASDLILLPGVFLKRLSLKYDPVKRFGKNRKARIGRIKGAFLAQRKSLALSPARKNHAL
jgi:hypothetical protein